MVFLKDHIRSKDSSRLSLSPGQENLSDSVENRMFLRLKGLIYSPGLPLPERKHSPGFIRVSILSSQPLSLLTAVQNRKRKSQTGLCPEAARPGLSSLCLCVHTNCTAEMCGCSSSSTAPHLSQIVRCS